MPNQSQALNLRPPERSFWHDTYASATYWSLSLQPRRIRAGWKVLTAMTGTVAVTITTGWGLLTHLAFTERATAAVLGVVVAVQFLAAVRWREGWQHDRTVVRPLAYRTAGVLDQAVADHRAWLTVPRDIGTNTEAKIIVNVPADFTAAERDMEDITRAVAVSTGWPSPQAELVLKSRKPRLVYSQPKPPPLAVGLPDIRPRIDAVKPSVVVLGLAAGFEPVEVDLDSEAPHLGVSIKTGGGKSEFLKNVAAQVLYHGGIVMILDYKLTSHMWADQLPNVSYARTPQEIQQALMWLAWDEYDMDGNVIKACELTRRKEAVLAARRERKPLPPWPRLLVLAEEKNATTRALKRFHRRTGGKGTSPALESIDETGETGRFIRVNVAHAAQRLSAKASGADGSRDAFENIGGIVTKDPNEQTWKLVGGGHAQPPKSDHKGRYQWITEAGVTVFQSVLYDKDPDKSDDIAKDLAMAGEIASPPSDMPFVWRGPLVVPTGSGHELPARQEGAEQAFGCTQEPGVLTVGEGPRRAVTIAEMVAAGLFVTKGAAAKALKRAGIKHEGGDRYTTGWTYALSDVNELLKAKGKR